MKPTNFKLLGKSTSEPPSSPDEAIIETFPNKFPEKSYLIQFDCMEFTSLCPITRQSDYAKIKIKYIPNEFCIETKSLKYYLQSYRSQRAFNEEIINRISRDLAAACKPRWMEVKGEFAPRGGIALTTTVEYPDKE